jgi:oligopeptide/dipeptide ABC transporter ATP-binding protein
LTTSSPPPLLDVCELKVEYAGRRNRPAVRAVDGVSFHLGTHETLGLVGESGSGKTTIGRAILGLTPVTDGRVMFDGADITHADARVRRRLSSTLQVVFQDPYGSLNPTRTVGQTLAEPVAARRTVPRDEVKRRVEEMLGRVGLAPDAGRRYPNAFSGGQRQRIAIARALMVQPRLVICDEPVSALDLSVQAQVLNLLKELQDSLELSYLFIAHDLHVVRHLSHRIVVLYRGQVMEEGPAELVYTRPSHPYTRALLDASPSPDPDVQWRRRAQRVRPVRSESSSPTGDGCPFVDRCPYAILTCTTQRPHLEPTGSGASVACHRWDELPAYAPGEQTAGVASRLPRRSTHA